MLAAVAAKSRRQQGTRRGGFSGTRGSRHSSYGGAAEMCIRRPNGRSSAAHSAPLAAASASGRSFTRRSRGAERRTRSCHARLDSCWSGCRSGERCYASARGCEREGPRALRLARSRPHHRRGLFSSHLRLPRTWRWRGAGRALVPPSLDGVGRRLVTEPGRIDRATVVGGWRPRGGLRCGNERDVRGSRWRRLSGYGIARKTGTRGPDDPSTARNQIEGLVKIDD